MTRIRVLNSQILVTEEKDGAANLICAQYLDNFQDVYPPSDLVVLDAYFSRQTSCESIQSTDRKKTDIYDNGSVKPYADGVHLYNNLAPLTSDCERNRNLKANFSNRGSYIHELPLIHFLSVPENAISLIYSNKLGDWIVLENENGDQLLVKEWQYDSFILKQRAYWDPGRGNERTVDKHTSLVSTVKFGSNRKFIVLVFLGKSFRSFDLRRCRDFCSFIVSNLVHLDRSAIESTIYKFVAAVTRYRSKIHLRSIQIVGHVLMANYSNELIFKSHLRCSSSYRSSVSSIPLNSIFKLCSWKENLLIWNAIRRASCIAFHPNGKEIATLIPRSQIFVFDFPTGRIKLGRCLFAKNFSAICYSANGQYLIAADQSKFVWIYYAKSAEVSGLRGRLRVNTSLSAFDITRKLAKILTKGTLKKISIVNRYFGGDCTFNL